MTAVGEGLALVAIFDGGGGEGGEGCGSGIGRSAVRCQFPSPK